MAGITEQELLTLKDSFSRDALKVLRAVALQPYIDSAHWCRVYTPDLSPAGARLFPER